MTDISVEKLAARYSAAFPDRPGLAADKGWLTGTWAIGACYKNPNDLYGAYPYGYLDRVHAMFPNARNILHVFSGGLTKEAAIKAASTPARVIASEPRVELVDLCGPELGRYPTFQGDIMSMPEDWHGRFDLILADPPYSAEDASKYGVPMVNRGAATRHLRKFCEPGGTLVWLDVCWPMHRKDRWRTYGHIGLVRSTNHRMRLVSLFEAV